MAGLLEYAFIILDAITYLPPIRFYPELSFGTVFLPSRWRQLSVLGLLQISQNDYSLYKKNIEMAGQEEEGKR